METNVEQLITKILESFTKIDYIQTSDIPELDLYMDQVTTLMDSKLKNTTRKPDEDKILTKTMINNYTKSDLLPPPVRKKYTKEHVLIMTFIFYFKSVMSINDIQSVLKPITDRYFGKDGLGIDDIYDEILQMEVTQMFRLKDDVLNKCKIARESFEGVEDENKDFLQTFALISMMSMDVYSKKLIIERLIDQLNEMAVPEDKGKEDKKEEKKEHTK